MQAASHTPLLISPSVCFFSACSLCAPTCRRGLHFILAFSGNPLYSTCGTVSLSARVVVSVGTGGLGPVPPLFFASVILKVSFASSRPLCGEGKSILLCFLSWAAFATIHLPFIFLINTFPSLWLDKEICSCCILFVFVKQFSNGTYIPCIGQ